MKKVFSLLLLMFFFISQQVVYAHPGRTDSSGGHTCRTNCEEWGLSYGEYHYHNGGSSSDSSSDNTGSSNDSWDNDCSDFSSYEEVVEYWNSKGYTKYYDPEKLDGWGNKVDDGVPCEPPSGYDTSVINGSPEQLAKKKAVQDAKEGEIDGYKDGLAAGQKGANNNSSTKGSDAFKRGYEEGYKKGYEKGLNQLNKKKSAAQKAGYALGKKQDKLMIPKQYQGVKALKTAFEDGFNKAIKEKEEAKKKEYLLLGTKDGKTDILNEPKNVKLIYLEAYKEGYKKGQDELKQTYIKKGYKAAFQIVYYKTPKLEKEKYIEWYKEGFKSNKERKKIQEAGYQAALDGEKYQVPIKYAHAKAIYEYGYKLGEEERKDNAKTAGGMMGAIVFGWLGRRYYVARKMVK